MAVVQLMGSSKEGDKIGTRYHRLESEQVTVFNETVSPLEQNGAF